MPKIYGPRTGSAAHVAICRIVELGGIASFAQVVAYLKPEQQPLKEFRQRVLIPLIDFGYVHVIDESKFKATSTGREYAGRHIPHLLPIAKTYHGQVALSRTHNPCRELNIKKHRAVAPFRPGSEDYKDIPSMIGGQRVAHKGSSN